MTLSGFHGCDSFQDSTDGWSRIHGESPWGQMRSRQGRGVAETILREALEEAGCLGLSLGAILFLESSHITLQVSRIKFLPKAPTF